MLHNYSMLYQVKTDGKVIVLPAQEQNVGIAGVIIYIMMLIQIAADE